MARRINNRTPKKNATEEKLRATPFRNVDILEAEQNSIRLSAWRRLTESKVVEELLTKPEFEHIKEELKAGLCCFLKGESKGQVYKIFSNGKGMQLEVNKKFAEGLGEHQVRFFQGVVQAGIEGYGALYMQVKGLLNRPDVSSDKLNSHDSD